MNVAQCCLSALGIAALVGSGCRTSSPGRLAEPTPTVIVDSAGVHPVPVILDWEFARFKEYKECALPESDENPARVPSPSIPTESLEPAERLAFVPSPLPNRQEEVPKPERSVVPIPLPSSSLRKVVQEPKESHWQLPCLVGLAIGGNAQFPDHDKEIAGVSVSLSECDRGDVFGLAVCGGVGEYDKLVGASLSGFISRHESLYGISVAGLGVDSDDYYGVEASFGVNLNNETVRGIQFAGLWNESRDVEGIQLAGLFNFGRLSGIQISLISNDATPDGPILSIERSILRGMCGMGCTAATMATGGAPIPLAESSQPAAEANGVQVSLCANVADHLTGLQIALVSNDSNKMTGLQLAAYNWTGELHGAQIGLINRACGGSGVQVGLVNGFGPEGDSTWNPLINIRF